MLDVQIIAPEVQPIGTVIWLHGLGSCSDDYLPIIPHMQLPNVRFVLPNAPFRPITIDGGYESRAWYDVKTLEDSDKRVSPLDVVDSSERLVELIENEKKHGIEPHQIILCGFVQGADMVYYMGMRYPKTLLGAIVMSGQPVMSHTLRAEASDSKTPFLFSHGERDLIVRIERSWEARMLAKKYRKPTEWNEYVVGHEICMESLRDVRLWMHARYESLTTDD